MNTVCAVCGGPIHRPAVVQRYPADYWLHLHQEDWIDNPHNARPRDEEVHTS